MAPRTSPSLTATLARFVIVGLSGCAPVASQVSGAAVAGAIETVQEPSTLEALEETTADPELQRAVEQVGAAAVRGALTAVEDGPISGEDLDAAIEDVGAALVRAMVRTGTASLADGLREDIVPAIDEASEQAGPRLAQLLDDDEIHEAVGALVYEVSRQSSLGIEDAMDQIRAENQATEEGGDANTADASG